MPRKTKSTIPATAPQVSARPWGILVIEDDPDLQWKLARMATVQGHRVVGVSSGEGALALIAQWPVDLVLVDDELPGISGIEVTKRIRDLRPVIPIVLMTTSNSSEFRLAARHAGAMACLIKPFRSEIMTEVIQHLPSWHAALAAKH